jgi:hypothetical protein
LGDLSGFEPTSGLQHIRVARLWGIITMTRLLAFWPLCWSVISTAQAEGPPKAEVVIRHAKVITVDRDSRIAEAVAIRGDRIVAVGTDAEA